ncbi:MAG: dihydrofolate reductase, partial [Bacteroidota bacterium]
MKVKSIFFLGAMLVILASACSGNKKNEADQTKLAEVDTIPFEVEAERFADLQVLRYQVKGFESLSLQQKQLAYYLYEAAMCGRDIIYDQKYKYNLTIRKTIDAIYSTYKGD